MERSGDALVLGCFRVESVTDGVDQQREPRDALHGEGEEGLDRQPLALPPLLQPTNHVPESCVLRPARSDTAV